MHFLFLIWDINFDFRGVWLINLILKFRSTKHDVESGIRDKGDQFNNIIDNILQLFFKILKSWISFFEKKKKKEKISQQFPLLTLTSDTIPSIHLVETRVDPFLKVQA